MPLQLPLQRACRPTCSCQVQQFQSPSKLKQPASNTLLLPCTMPKQRQGEPIELLARANLQHLMLTAVAQTCESLQATSTAFKRMLDHVLTFVSVPALYSRILPSSLPTTTCPLPLVAMHANLGPAKSLPPLYCTMPCLVRKSHLASLLLCRPRKVAESSNWASLVRPAI